MSRLAGRGNLIKGSERKLFGWSISNILLATSALAVVNAALFQYFVLFALSGQFQKIYEQEVSAKVVAHVEGHRARILRAMQSQSVASLRQVAADMLGLDEAYQLVLFYDPQGKYVSFSQKENVSLELVKAISQAAGLQTLRSNVFSQKSALVEVVKASQQRTMDALLPMDLKSDFLSGAKPARIGYVRMLASLSKVDEKLLQIRIWGSVLVIFTTALSTLLFLYIIQKTVARPIDRAVSMMEGLVADVERIPPLELKKSDALQVKRLMRALHAGLSEILIRQRTLGLLDRTRKILESKLDGSLFFELKSIWLASKLVQECHVFLVRKGHGDSFFVDADSSGDPSSVSDTLRGKGNLARRSNQLAELQKDFVVEAALKLAAREMEIDWADQWLMAKVSVQVVAEESFLVLAIVPSEASGMAPDKFEELSLEWLREVARLQQVSRYRILAGEIEISRELRRRVVSFHGDHDNSDGSEFETMVACESQVGAKGLGDFVFVSNLLNRKVSVSVVGNVNGQDFRAGLAAAGVVAAMTDRFQVLHSSDQQRVVKGLVSSINSYLWNTYAGKLGASCTIMVFDHEQGVGSFVSYGGGHPFLLTPMERKPMLMVQTEPCSPLGLSEVFHSVSTAFPLIPGQIVFVGTPGLFDLEGAHGLRFEKYLVSGGLSEVVDASYTESAKVLIQRVFDAVRKFSGTQVTASDMTAFVLMRQQTRK
jgi:hypothetical protein